MSCFVYVLGSEWEGGYRTYVGWTTAIIERRKKIKNLTIQNRRSFDPRGRMGFVICGALCHAEGGNEQGMAYQTGSGVSEAVMENNKFRCNYQWPLMATN